MSESTNLEEMSGRVSCYDVPANYSLPFINKPRHETQSAPVDWFKAIHPFVVDWFRETDDWTVQCVFCLGRSYSNNHYIIFILDRIAHRLYHLILCSATVYPPVWDRGFGGLDYHDYLKTQRAVKSIMDKEGMSGFVVDESLEGKFVHMTKESPDEVRRLLAEGKSYSILALRAEAMRDKLTLTSITPST